MKIKKMISKFLKLKRIKEIETMLSVKLPQDYKTFLLENNGAIKTLFGTLSFSNDKVPNSVLIADSIQHGFVVIICSGADKGVYYWDDSHVYNISNEDCNMYKIANDFSGFLKILEYHDEEASIPY